MQVHGVPESERATDGHGNRLPWAYEMKAIRNQDSSFQRRRNRAIRASVNAASAYPDFVPIISLTEFLFDSENGMPRRSGHAEEKGAFGKPIHRHRAEMRGKSTPLRSAKEDQLKAENVRQEDAIFGKLIEESRAVTAERERSTRRLQHQKPLTPTGGFGPGLIECDSPNTENFGPEAGEPTEVMLYGFPGSFQYAAVEFYERVSGGMVYENYDRAAPKTRFQPGTQRRTAAATNTHIPTAARRMLQVIRGGDCWIKVTYDSREAAFKACRASPHVLHGYKVYAELFTGKPPTKDEPILAIPPNPSSTGPSPFMFSSMSNQPDPHRPLDPTGEEQRGTSPLQDHYSTSQRPFPSPPASQFRRSFQSPLDPYDENTGTTTAMADSALSLKPRPIRFQGAKRAVLLSAEEALLPVKPAWQQMLGSWPLIGHFFGDDDIIGNQVPRTEQGEFDWQKASFYWQFWAYVDYWTNSDFCGLRSEDE